MLYTLLQTYPAGSSGFMALGGNAGYFLLIVLIGIAGYIVQARLQSVFAKYAREPIPGGMTGAEVAEKMLRENHVHNVKITHVSGHLTDHFNPQTMTVNLSDSVYASQSISALAVACHECGHAVQHAQGYAPLVLRSQLVPLVSFASRTAQWVIIIGLIILASTNNAVVAWAGSLFGHHAACRVQCFGPGAGLAGVEPHVAGRADRPRPRGAALGGPDLSGSRAGRHRIGALLRHARHGRSSQ